MNIKQLLSGIACLMIPFMVSADYYEVTGDNINLRRTPNGEVFGKVAKGTFFYSAVEPKDGWIYMRTPRQGGFISDKYVRKVETADFSRDMLGEYWGFPTDPSWSYSQGELTENDGWLVLRFTDWSQPLESGIRMSQNYTWVGVPTPEGVTFKYNMSYIDPTITVTDQVVGLPETNVNYIVTKGPDGTRSLRGFYRNFELQESSGFKDPVISERNLFDLTGPVKKLVKARSFTPDAMALFEENPSDLNLNLVWQLDFDKEGYITGYTSMNTDTSQPLSQYSYTRNGNRVNVIGEHIGVPVKVNYTLHFTPFSIEYANGTGVVGSEDRSYEISGDNITYLGWNGTPTQKSYFEWQAPFVLESSYNEISTYKIRNGKTEGVSLNLQMGGDEYAFPDLKFRDVQTDSKGNWIRRVAYRGEKPFFLELRNIEYY